MDRLIEKIKQTGNPTVFGLDPRLSFVPQHLQDQSFERYGRTARGAAHAILHFNYGLIDALAGIVPCVKPQSAYYEMYGIDGLKTLKKTIDYAKEKGLYVLLDVKRNDIGSTAEAYATAYLGETDLGNGMHERMFDCDGVTVNGYLGTDGIQPFADACKQFDKSCFVLVKTSNPSSGELQDVSCGDEMVCEKMAHLVEQWGADSIGEYGYSRVGAVVGATWPQQAEILRAIMPHTYFLVPGYGAQGGGAKDVIVNFNKDGLGAIVNSSRAIMCAYQKGDWQPEAYAEAARAEAVRMRDEITALL